MAKKVGDMFYHPTEKEGESILLVVAREIGACDGCVFNHKTKSCYSATIGERDSSITGLCADHKIIFVPLAKQCEREGEQIEKKYTEVRNDVINQIVVIARGILMTNPHLVNFTMGYGTCFFTDKEGEKHPVIEGKLSEFKAIKSFILKWDKAFALTEEIMKVTTSERESDWR